MILHSQPKTFVIALKDHPVSEKQLQDCLASANQHDWNIEVSWGVYGNTVTDETWKSLGIKSYIGKPGAAGCWLSHFYLWKKCVELNEPIIVLEHDAVIQSQWKEIAIDKSLLKLHMHYRKDPTSYKWNHSVTGIWSPSTHAYCITPDHAEILINCAKNIGSYPADMFMGSNVISVALLGPPELVSRQNNYSTTGNLN